MHIVQKSNLEQQLRHDKQCAYPHPLKFLRVFLIPIPSQLSIGIDEGVMHNMDVGSFITEHSMDEEVEFFTCWHYHYWHCTHCKHLSKDMPTMKITAASIIRSTNVKHTLSDINGKTCTYDSKTRIFSI